VSAAHRRTAEPSNLHMVTWLSAVLVASALRHADSRLVLLVLGVPGVALYFLSRRMVHRIDAELREGRKAVRESDSAHIVMAAVEAHLRNMQRILGPK
jgi:hypothetical protein